MPYVDLTLYRFLIQWFFSDHSQSISGTSSVPSRHFAYVQIAALFSVDLSQLLIDWPISLRLRTVSFTSSVKGILQALSESLRFLSFFCWGHRIPKQSFGIYKWEDSSDAFFFFLTQLITRILIDFPRTATMQVSVYCTVRYTKLSHYAWDLLTPTFPQSFVTMSAFRLTQIKPIFLTVQSTGKYCTSNLKSPCRFGSRTYLYVSTKNK